MPWAHLATAGFEGWSEWGSFGIEIHGQPKVVINRHGGLEVFAVGPRGRLGHVWQWEGVSHWSHWEDLGPPIADDRFAVCQIALPAGVGSPVGLASPAAAVVGPAAVLGTEKLARTRPRVTPTRSEPISASSVQDPPASR